MKELMNSNWTKTIHSLCKKYYWIIRVPALRFSNLVETLMGDK
jgi:hypothetical protein